MLDKDPFVAREAKKYVNPIPSREYILASLKELNMPANRSELASHLNLTDEQALIAFKRRIKAMLRDGQLERLRGGYFWPSDATTKIRGKIIINKSSKYPILIPEDGSDNIIITSQYGMPVYSGNIAVVAVADVNFDIDHTREGRIVEIIEQQKITVSGRFIEEDENSYVVPYGKTILQDIIIEDPAKNIKQNDIVIVEIIKHASKYMAPTGKIMQVLGNVDSSNIEIKTAIAAFDLPNEWPDQVTKQADKISTKISPKIIKERLDLRKLPLVTIDGSDSKDFDDAVFCERNKTSGWTLYVAIADVGFYIETDSAIDLEAKLRGNSVYFPNQVIPMLPEKLSNNLCSLVPNEDRLCLVCKMQISNDGVVSKYSFHDAIMRSQQRFTYEQVAGLIEKPTKEFHYVQELYNLYLALEKTRITRGAIDFATCETKIIFDKNSKIDKITPAPRLISHRIIEECMLAANVCAASFLSEHEVPTIYRNHNAPAAEKKQEVTRFLNELGLSFDGDYNKLITSITDRADFNIIQSVLLRSLSQANYTTENIGHFGLAYEQYTHFTSPIRRYTDLIIHRQIRDIINNRKPKKDNAEPQEKLDEIAQHCSMTERRADDATRDVTTWLKCQYMQQHLGDSFTGVISGVINFGFFVELQDLYIDGMVHVSQLKDDYYIFDAIHHNLTGERSGKTYKLGDIIKVTVIKVDVDNRRIDLSLIEENTKNGKKLKRKNLRN